MIFCNFYCITRKMSACNVLTRTLLRGARFKECSLPSYQRRVQHSSESIKSASVEAASLSIKEQEHEQRIT